MLTFTIRVLLSGVFMVSLLVCSAQPIEDVIVEKYHVQETADGGAPLVTYRVFLDLAPGHYLQMVYGDEHHELRLETSTEFHNSSGGNVRFGDRSPIDANDVHTLTQDSWLTIGMVGIAHTGIPLALDTNGTILDCDGTVEKHDPLCEVDGLFPMSSMREVVNFLLDPSYLGNMRGSVIATNDGAWAMLGGLKGSTSENIVLVAQLVTTGELHLVLNAQLGTPDGGYVKVVAKDAREGELQLGALTVGSRRLN